MRGLCVDYGFDAKLSTRIVNNGAGFGTMWTMWTMVRLVLNKSNKYIILIAYMVILLEQASDCKVVSTLST